MTPLTLLIRTVAGVVSAVLVAGTSLTFLGPMLQRSETTEHPVPTDITRLSMKNGLGEVEIRQARDGEQPSATLTSEWGLREPDVTVRQSSDTLTIDSGCEGGVWPDVCNTRWVVVVPEGTDVEVESGVGSLSTDDLDGDLRARVGVGSVTTTGSRSGIVDVQVGVGGAELELAEAADRASIQVGVGDVTATMPGDESYSVSFDGMPDSLDNQIGDDPGAAHTVSVEAGVGTVRLLES